VQRAGKRRGFTLLEVLVALAIGGVAIMGARMLLEAVNAHAVRVAAAARQADADSNTELMLRSVLARTSTDGDSAARFDGTTEEVRFPTRCNVPSGWQERCDARLAVEAPGMAGQVGVVLELSTGERVVVRRGLSSASLVYLATAVDGGRWTPAWRSAITPPSAMALVFRGADARVDTMIVRIGSGG
jgi:prepilin-type N-terminal cleavage/methylation domain-containing protein